jgi:hypothetical protein
MSSQSVLGIVDAFTPAVMPFSAGAEPPLILEPPSNSPVTAVRFTNSELAYLNSVNPDVARHQQVLETMMAIGRPVFVKVSPRRSVEDVRIPIVGRVVEFHRVEDGIEVHLDGSAARLTLPAPLVSGEAVDLLRRSRREGRLIAIVDERMTNAIVDLNLAPIEFESIFPPLRSSPAEIPTLILNQLSEVDEATAQRLFTSMAGASCEVGHMRPGCIPFLYSKDGCFARAHEMCRRMACGGVIAAKLWVFGRLRPRTPNDPSCVAEWGVHVAPVIRLGGTRQLLVIDPSLCDRAVPRATWEAALNDPAALSVFTESRVFLRSVLGGDRVEGPPRKGMTEAEDYFIEYRIKLGEMNPPPPFEHCRRTNP